MSYTPTILVTTELDAVNACLRAGGEAAVSTVVGQRPDVDAAQALVREASREVQAAGWRFNTEFGLEVAPTDSFMWSDSTLAETELNVFVPPANLLSFTVTKHPLQQGSNYLDTVVRPSVKWSAGTLVFYDRTYNRDGFPRSAIYIDPVWLFDFEKLPQSARALVTIKAVRKYLRQIVQDFAASDRMAEEEERALRTLRQEEQEVDDYNLFNNFAISQHLGGRPPRPGGVVDYRATRGSL